MQNDNSKQSPISEYLLKLQLIVSNTEFKNKTEANKYETLESAEAGNIYVHAVNKTDTFELYQYDSKYAERELIIIRISWEFTFQIFNIFVFKFKI